MKTYVFCQSRLWRRMDDNSKPSVVNTNDWVTTLRLAVFQSFRSHDMTSIFGSDSYRHMSSVILNEILLSTCDSFHIGLWYANESSFEIRVFRVRAGSSGFTSDQISGPALVFFIRSLIGSILSHVCILLILLCYHFCIGSHVLFGMTTSQLI